VAEDAQSPSAGNSDQAENAPVTPRLPTRRIWLCADDYGISPGVSEAIRELIARGRLNATSAMVVAPSFGPSAALQFSNRMAGKTGVAIGLHLTMTAPFRPLTAFTPVTKDGTFPPISDMLVRAFWPRFDRALVAREVEAQIDAFVAAFARPPDFVDGHHHVHALPVIREALLDALTRRFPSGGPLLRDPADAAPAILARRIVARKALTAAMLAFGFRRQAEAAGFATNRGFSGYSTFGAIPYAREFDAFLIDLGPRPMIMCHPGLPDDELGAADEIAARRPEEHAFLSERDGLPDLIWHVTTRDAAGFPWAAG